MPPLTATHAYAPKHPATTHRQQGIEDTQLPQQHHNTHPPAHSAQPTTPTTAPDAPSTRTLAWFMAAPPSSSALTTASCPFSLAMNRGVAPRAYHAQHHNTTIPHPRSHNHTQPNNTQAASRQLNHKLPEVQSQFHILLFSLDAVPLEPTAPRTHSKPPRTSHSPQRPAYHSTTPTTVRDAPSTRTLAWLMAAPPPSSALTTVPCPF